MISVKVGLYDRVMYHEMEQWLHENIGKENVDWKWEYWHIHLPTEEDVIALKLKFSI